MRHRLLLLVLSSLISVACGQATGQPETPAETPVATIVEDPAGDVRVNLNGPPRPLSDGIDLRRFSIQELADLSIEFNWTFQAYEYDTADLQRLVSARFSFKDLNYIIRLPTGACQPGLASLESSSPDGDLELLACLEWSGDSATATWSIQVPRTLIVDSDNRIPQVGDLLEGVLANSGDGTNSIDLAPDSVAGVTHTIQRGDVKSGEVFAVADPSVRSSNGEANTLVYNVTVYNTRATALRLLPIAQPSAGLDTRTPSRVLVPANGNASFPVAVTIPFAHEHATTRLVTIDLVEQGGQRLAQVSVAIHWHDIAQPSGHHPRLYLHSNTAPGTGIAVPGSGLTVGEGEERLWMNSLEQDLTIQSDDGPTRPTWSKPITVGTSPSTDLHSTWIIPLRPRLAIGLDFQAGQVVPLTTTIELPFTDPNLVVKAGLCLAVSQTADEDGEFCAAAGLLEGVLLAYSEIANGETSQGAHEFELELALTNEADFVPYQREKNLYLAIQVAHATPVIPVAQGQEIRLHAGASHLSLPLLEYHERVQDLFPASSVRIEGNRSLRGNPGDTIRTTLTVTTTGTTTMDLLAHGTRAPWITFNPSQVRGPRSQAELVVNIPTDATQGQGEFMVVVDDSKGEFAMERFVVEVVPEAVEAIEPTAGGPAKKSPGFGLASILLGMAILLVRRRT